MDGTQSIETHYRSLDQQYLLCNFHRQDDLDRAEAFLSSPDDTPPKVLLLAGERGSGRNYFLKSVVYRLRKAGRKMDLISIDLDGYEPNLSSIIDAINHQIVKNKWNPTLLPTATKLVLKTPSLWDFLSFSAAIQLEWSADNLSTFWQASSQELPGPKRRERHRFHRLLETLCEEGICVLHVIDSAELTDPLRGWVLAEAKLVPRLRVVFSCRPDEDAESVAPETPSLRIEFAPLDKRACLAVIDQRLTPNAFPSELTDALWRSSQGLPGYLAIKILDLLASELVFEDAQGVWRTTDRGLTDEAFIREFVIDFYEMIEQALAKLPAPARDSLRDFLRLAALCGENVPADLIFQYLRVKGEERDALVDAIDDWWVGDRWDALFVDHEYGHPSFPAHALYSFVNPLYPPILLREVSKRQRTDLASGLLAFLNGTLPIQTRGIARLFLELCRHLDNPQARARYETELAWWIGVEEAEELTRHLARALRERRLEPDVLWQVARTNQTTWLPYRRLALLEALEQQEQGVPVKWMCAFLHEKALALHEMGQYAEAEPLYRRALAIAERSYGSDHPEVAAALNNLAHLLQDTNRLTEAEPLYRRALAIAEQSYGPDHPHVAHALNNLAGLLRDINRLTEAKPLYRRALVIYEKSYGPDHPHIARALNNLARLLQDTNRLTEAEPLYRRALVIYEKSYGPDHPDVAAALNNLALLLRDINRLTEAEPLFRRALVIFLNFTRATGHEHSRLRTAVGDYGRLLEEMGFTADLIAHRLVKVGRKAGFDEESWRQMLAQLQ